MDQVLIDRVFELQSKGLSSGQIVAVLKLSVTPQEIRLIARRAGRPFGSLRALAGGPKEMKPVSRGLRDSFARLRPGRCSYIEGEVHDPDATPCGERVCVVQLDSRDPELSSWCARHHEIVKVIRGRHTRFIDGVRSVRLEEA